MKVLVTGGAGYIGCVAVERLISAGHSVVVLDNLSQGHRAAVHPEATFIEGDLSDPDRIESVFSAHPIDAVMHFASRTLVGESMQKPFLYLGENVICGRNLLECMLRTGRDMLMARDTMSIGGFATPEISDDICSF